MNKQLFLSLALTLLFCGANAEAGKLANQQRRIDSGVKNGRLNTEETQALTTEHKALEGLRQDAKADGKVSDEERAAFRKAAAAASQNIYKAKHNVNTQSGQ